MPRPEYEQASPQERKQMLAAWKADMARAEIRKHNPKAIAEAAAMARWTMNKGRPESGR